MIRDDPFQVFRPSRPAVVSASPPQSFSQIRLSANGAFPFFKNTEALLTRAASRQLSDFLHTQIFLASVSDGSSPEHSNPGKTRHAKVPSRCARSHPDRPTLWILHSQRLKSRRRFKGNFETWTRLGLFNNHSASRGTHSWASRGSRAFGWGQKAIDT